MQIAKVIGTVVSTHKTRTLMGMKFLLLKFIDERGNPLEGYEVAGDMVGAGINEWVLVTRGSAARIEPSNEGRPLDAMVVGIIDTISVERTMLYSKKDAERV